VRLRAEHSRVELKASLDRGRRHTDMVESAEFHTHSPSPVIASTRVLLCRPEHRLRAAIQFLCFGLDCRVAAILAMTQAKAGGR
jgi:hypothetical protein